jgi:hypothetical protein
MLNSSLETVSRWGLLPPALLLGVILGARLGAIVLPRSSPPERTLFGAVAAIALVVSGVRVLGVWGGLQQETIFGGLFVSAVAALLISRDRRIGLTWRGVVTKETIPVAILAACVLVMSIAAAYLLPIWQWDALGYHLPYVNFALQGGSFSDVPRDMPYLSTYPHVVENFFLAWRAMLPDDRLVDAAQIPFALLGALAIAVLAHQAGARRDHAAAAGLLWLTLPAVFLQLPTNYIDVAAAGLLLAGAALSLAEPTAAHVVAAGVAVGLFLGTKPNAPLGATLLYGVIAARGWRAGRRWSFVAAAACTVLLGAESYVMNLVQHRNPIWPVELSIGPIVLPGEVTMDTLLASGCGAPRVHGLLPFRILRSWTALNAPPMFDMRYGGLGIVFLVALPAAVAVTVRRRSLAIAVVMLATLASPDPAVPRYILAFPGIVLALAASLLSATPEWTRRAAFGLASVTAAIGLYRAYPGLTGEGPALSAYLKMTDAERLRAVGADGSPARFFDALERIEPAKTTAFDSSLELPLLAWPSDLSTRAMHIPDGVSDEDALRLVSDRNLALFIVGEGSPVAKAARQMEAAFTELFRCRSGSPPPCLVAAASNLDEANAERALDILNLRWSSCVVLLRK